MKNIKKTNSINSTTKKAGKKVDKKEKEKRTKTIKKRYNTKAIVIFTSFIVICVAAIIGIVMLARYLVIKYKYSYYTNRMEWYGYSLLYDNESASSNESVMSDEIAKMVAGVLYNSTDKEYAKDNLFSDGISSLNTNESWLAFAKTIPLTSVKNIVMGEKASKFQVANLIVDGIEMLYDRDIEITEQLKEKYRKNYTEEELLVIDKAISLGILKNTKSDVDKVGMLKGELNKMLITVAEKYAMMHYRSRYWTDNNISLVTDEKLQPTNADKYPYIVDSIPKEIYEIELPEMLSEISLTPKEVYDIYSDVYSKTDSNIIEFFDVVLNVDYKTIDTESFIQALNPYVSYDINSKVSGEYVYRGEIEEYVKYVKENEIVLSGSVTPLLPIIYSNGMVQYARCKIDFKVANSKTNKNLLLWDEDVTYNGNDIQVYSDIIITPPARSKALRVYTGSSLTRNIALDVDNLIT